MQVRSVEPAKTVKIEVRTRLVGGIALTLALIVLLFDRPDGECVGVRKPVAAPVEGGAAAKVRVETAPLALDTRVLKECPRSVDGPPRELADPDRIGPCPNDHSPVLRRGYDTNQQATWWHADGSMTVRIQQAETLRNGRVRVVPKIVLARPAVALPAPKD